jgi:hypothetical protein
MMNKPSIERPVERLWLPYSHLFSLHHRVLQAADNGEKVESTLRRDIHPKREPLVAIIVNEVLD